MTGRDPVHFSPCDNTLLCYIRRMNLDAMWAQEPRTVYGNLLNVKENINIWEMLGVKPESTLLKMGPLPLEYVMGYGIAINMLVKTLQAGRYADYMQFDMVRKLRSAFSNLYNASLGMAVSQRYLGRDLWLSLLTQCPNQSLWFKRFALCCLNQIGQIVKFNAAMTIEVVLEILQRLDIDTIRADGWDRILLLMVIAAVTIGFGGSLRGHEIFLKDLHGVSNHLTKGRSATSTVIENVIVTPFVWLKGKTVERYHLNPLASVTESGVEIRCKVTALVVAWDMRGVRRGPFFQDRNGEDIDMGKLDGIMHRFLNQIQVERTELIPYDVNV
uniref:Uncharacterized protein n=1 Tax=Odontella aurita TaxID=265563 RepID=A0A7S4K4E0_9STRA|mmetsp:Transcript_61293/g.181264  ORF Transcript_61293/g.181264 Transcript_61293/m.181264 type:complete len:329 (+) Transcript_61293:1689-2675(+)